MRRRILVVALLAVAACGDRGGNNQDSRLPDPAIAGDYSGTFPCSNCPGIRASLRLTDSGHFMLEQVYLGDESATDSMAASVGRWHWEPADSTIVLRGSGPLRSFTRDGGDSLLMQTNSPDEYRVDRNPERLAFAANLPLSGEVVSGSEGVAIRECLTGLTLPVAMSGDYAAMARQLRRVGGGSTVLAEFDGRFTWTAAGEPAALRIERFGTLRADRACR